MIHITMVSTHTLLCCVNHVILNLQMQGGDTSIHPVHQSSSSVKIPIQESNKKIRTSQRSNNDYKGPVGQEPTSYKGTTIDAYTVEGILRYSLREIDHVQIFAIGKYYGQGLREKQCSQRSSIIFGGN